MGDIPEYMVGLPEPEFPIGYEPPQSRSGGHYHVIVGDIINDRYQILRLAGQGHFSKVCECVDMGAIGPDGRRVTPPLERRVVAIKIVRDRTDYVQDAKDELDILRNLIERDREDRYPFIKPLRTFWHRNHFCILFPKFGGTLLDFLQKHGRFTIEFVSQYSYRLFNTLLFLHRECRLTHTDLKPENILLELRGYSHRQRKRVPRSYGIRVIDFGSATHEDEYHGRIVSTRHYRAPEVVLGSGWSYPADIWSVGCILYELLTGEMLFDTHDDRQHLAMMERVLEQPLLRPSTINSDVESYFNPDGTLRPPDDAELLAAVHALRPLRQTLAAWPTLLNLVLRCLCIDPAESVDRLLSTRTCLTCLTALVLCRIPNFSTRAALLFRHAFSLPLPPHSQQAYHRGERAP